MQDITLVNQQLSTLLQNTKKHFKVGLGNEQHSPRKDQHAGLGERIKNLFRRGCRLMFGKRFEQSNLSHLHCVSSRYQGVQWLVQIYSQFTHCGLYTGPHKMQ